jgi:hypothetical protein
MAMIVPVAMRVVVVLRLIVVLRVIVTLRSGRMGMLVSVPVVLVPRRRFVALRVAGAVLPMLAFGRMVMASMIVSFHSAHLTSLARGSA